MFKKSIYFGLSLALSAGLLSCSTPNGLLNSNSNLTHTFAQSGSIKGQIILPGRLKDSQVAALNSDFVLAYFAGLAAIAQEEGDTVDLTKEDVENFEATVNGEEVDIEVTNIETNEETGETEVSYEIAEAPASEGKEVLEIKTKDGEAILGAITDVEEDQTTEQDVDTESTSILATAEEIHGKMKISDLTDEDLKQLALDPAVLNMKASLRSILKKDGTLKKNKARLFGLVSDCTQEDAPDEETTETAETAETDNEVGTLTTQANDKAKGKAQSGKDKASAAKDKGQKAAASGKSKAKNQTRCPKESPYAGDDNDENKETAAATESNESTEEATETTESNESTEEATETTESNESANENA